MKTLYKYGLVILGFLILGSSVVEAQEKEKVKNLRELKQLEKGYVEVDEVDPLTIITMPDVPDLQDIYYTSYTGATSIRMRKKVSDLSLSHKYHFNVEEKYSGINFFILGEVTEGSIRIKLTKPDKTLFKDINVVPGKNFHWDQSFTLDKVNKGGIGKWTVELFCDNATGFYQFFSRSR